MRVVPPQLSSRCATRSVTLKQSSPLPLVTDDGTWGTAGTVCLFSDPPSGAGTERVDAEMSHVLRWVRNLSALPLLLGALTLVVTVIALGVIWPGLEGPWRAAFGAALAGVVVTRADRANDRRD